MEGYTSSALSPPTSLEASSVLTSNTAGNLHQLPGHTIPATAPTHPRSCNFCRQRKVKCDRKKPCSYCVRSRMECVYPPGQGRAAKKPRNTVNVQVFERLNRLEDTIKRLTAERDATNNHSDMISRSCEELRPIYEQSNYDASMEQQCGRLIVEDTRSQYISNILWANLANEIEEMRDMLYDSTSEDESYVQSQSSAPNLSSPLQPITSILGFPVTSTPMRAQHPPLFQSVALLGIFTENVLPLVHIFHMPTTSRVYWDAIESLNSLDKNTEALLFSIYYSAILSVDPKNRESILGISSSNAVEAYRFAVEQAIVKADILNTRSILLLQAVVLFLSSLRNEDDSRLVWSLVPLVLRIAQAMGLHRDGSIFGLKPLEVEVRRRLWYHICLLDIRASEYYGYEPIVHEATFDTKIPLNVNDSNIDHQMINPPVECEGQTEMTFCLLRCEAMKVGWKIGYAPPSLRVPGLAKEELSARAREELVESLNTQMEEKYLRYCDSAQPLQRFYSVVARSIIARTRLVVLYPTAPGSHSCTPRLSLDARNRLFSICMEVLELSNLLLTDKELARWAWHCRTYVQWHAIAFILSDICSRPPSAECERAWECVNIILDGWQAKKQDKDGSLWGPVRRLMAKARYVREIQKRDSLEGSENAPASFLPQPSGERVQAASDTFDQISATMPAKSDLMHSLQASEWRETPGPYIEPTLEDLDIDSITPWWVNTSITM